MGLKLANNAVSRLAAGCSNVATSITLQPGEGALFPVLGAGDFFPVTISKVDGTNEIVLCTARDTDVLTITRAQESTSAKSFLSGDRVELRLTAGALLSFENPAAVTWSTLPGKPTFAPVATSGDYADLDGLPSLFSGAYGDLAGKPTLGTVAAKDFGTAAGNLVELDGSGKLPAVDGSQLTGIVGTPSGAILSLPAGAAAPTGFIAPNAVYTIATYPTLAALFASVPDAVTPAAGVAMTGLSSTNAAAFYAYSPTLGMWVVATNMAAAATRSANDGATWTSTTIGHTCNGGLAWGNGKFLSANLVSTTGTTRQSADGVTWSAASSQPLTNLVSNGTIFVAQQYSAGSQTVNVLSSPDGVTWTARLNASYTGMTIVAAQGGGFFVMATDGSTGARALYSLDGIAWVEVGIIGDGLTANVIGMSASGVVLAHYNGQVYRSHDYGRGWCATGIIIVSTNASAGIVGGRWIVHDANTTGTLVTYTAYETGGFGSLAWTRRTSAALSPVPTAVAQPLRVSNGKMMRGGVNGATFQAYMVADKSYSGTQFYIPPIGAANPQTVNYVKT